MGPPPANPSATARVSTRALTTTSPPPLQRGCRRLLPAPGTLRPPTSPPNKTPHLLVEHGLGLATKAGLLAVVAPLACGGGGAGGGDAVTAGQRDRTRGTATAANRFEGRRAPNAWTGSCSVALEGHRPEDAWHCGLPEGAAGRPAHKPNCRTSTAARCTRYMVLILLKLGTSFEPRLPPQEGPCPPLGGCRGSHPLSLPPLDPGHRHRQYLSVWGAAPPGASAHSPCAYRLALPVLYCVTFMVMCFLHPLQNAFLVLGMFTCAHSHDGQPLQRCRQYSLSCWRDLRPWVVQAAALGCTSALQLRLPRSQQPKHGCLTTVCSRCLRTAPRAAPRRRNAAAPRCGRVSRESLYTSHARPLPSQEARATGAAQRGG
jgi:hypothetical protein